MYIVFFVFFFVFFFFFFSFVFFFVFFCFVFISLLSEESSRTFDSSTFLLSHISFSSISFGIERSLVMVVAVVAVSEVVVGVVVSWGR